MFLNQRQKVHRIRFKIQPPLFKAIDGRWKVKSKYGADQPERVKIDVMKMQKKYILGGGNE
jgi:hypothetical protein